MHCIVTMGVLRCRSVFWWWSNKWEYPSFVFWSDDRRYWHIQVIIIMRDWNEASFKYDGIEFQFSTSDDDFVKAGAQDFTRWVLHIIENRMPENPIMTVVKKKLSVRNVFVRWRVDKSCIHEYGNTDIETLIEHFGQNKRSERFKLIPGQEFLSTLDDRMMICSNVCTHQIDVILSRPCVYIHSFRLK